MYDAIITKKSIKDIVRVRKDDSSKKNYGHALIVAGSLGMMGAAVIASRSCLRSGVGRLTVFIPKEERVIIQTTIPEAMVLARECSNIDFDRFDAACIGPGIGTDKASLKLVIAFLSTFSNSLVLDADALNIIAANKKILNVIPPKTIVTPHHQEFDRLFGEHLNNESRIITAKLKAKEYDIIIVLKGHITFIISLNRVYVNTKGNSGLAKGGSGDALTGIITSFLAQGYSSLNASIIAVYLHSLSADITLKEQSVESMLITDVINNIGKAFKKISE